MTTEANNEHFDVYVENLNSSNDKGTYQKKIDVFESDQESLYPTMDKIEGFENYFDYLNQLYDE